VCDATSCGVTYDRNSDDAGGVIYICNEFTIQATVVVLIKILGVNLLTLVSLNILLLLAKLSQCN